MNVTLVKIIRFTFLMYYSMEEIEHKKLNLQRYSFNNQLMLVSIVSNLSQDNEI